MASTLCLDDIYSKIFAIILFSIKVCLTYVSLQRTHTENLRTKGSSGGHSSRLFGLLISHRVLCGFESRPRRNFSLSYGCCDCP
ncbi:unnamed protein product [Acanthoscelides obtectus]|uniref:Uncharacterized protein n=1 Tax=Acanthoscelides obtectus TaxID=200917 RepID=A0A9P0M5E3_ACAOB|nr:unnamed protein product [Acanthoscelides obtectus]CAK1680311.1 hypothetical protein AOBTE_LOCUS32572 [Acanthoscelides obtectus]